MPEGWPGHDWVDSWDDYLFCTLAVWTFSEEARLHWLEGDIEASVQCLYHASFYQAYATSWLGRQLREPSAMTDDAILAAVFRALVVKRDMTL